MPLPNPPLPQHAASAIVEHEGRLLLVKRRNPPAADLFAFPGGRCEPGETPAEAALRELREETGIEGRLPLPFAVYDLNGENDAPGASTHFLLTVFTVKLAGPSEVLAGDDAVEAGWFGLSEIDQLVVPASVRECVDRIAAERGWIRAEERT